MVFKFSLSQQTVWIETASRVRCDLLTQLFQSVTDVSHIASDPSFERVELIELGLSVRDYLGRDFPVFDVAVEDKGEDTLLDGQDLLPGTQTLSTAFYHPYSN